MEGKGQFLTVRITHFNTQQRPATKNATVDSFAGNRILNFQIIEFGENVQ